MTVKLYETDAYLREFEATVLSCEETKGGYAVVLDQTVFFPEGGGQPADSGILEETTVTDVQIKDGIITHKTDKPLDVGTTIRGAIDWDLRFLRMQNHTGEHIVAGLIHNIYGYDNVGFHMSELSVTLDVSGPLTGVEIAGIEEAANRAVHENRSVTAWFPDEKDIASLDYRSKLELTENVRLITIDGVDVCACCAPHVARTGEIGVIKVLDYIPYKGGTRITLVSGMAAVRDYAALHAADREIMRLLSAPRGQTLEFVKRDHEALTALRTENARLTEQLVLARLTVEDIGGTLCGLTSGASFDALRACVESVSANGRMTAMFSVEDDGTASYILAMENGDVRDTVKALNAAFAGKGGGKPQYAQGKITATKDEILAFFK